MSPEFKTLLAKLTAKRDTIVEAVAPLRAERDKLAEKIAPAEARIQALNAAIKAAEQPALHDLNREIATLTGAVK